MTPPLLERPADRPGDGARRPAARAVVEDGEAVELVGATADVSPRKEAEEQASRLRDQLTRLARVTALGEMATAFAHELNQPLGALASNAESAEMLLRDGAAAEPELAAVLADIRFDAHRAARIINTIQVLVQHEPLPAAPLRLADVVHGVAAMLKSVTTARGIAVETQIPASLPLVEAGFTELQQLFYNLMMNAVDALTPVQRRPRRIRICARSADGHRVEVCVDDNGPGIDAALRPHVFDAFFTTKPGGIGVGLSMCRRIAEALGGDIRAERAPGGGARMRLTLRAWEGKEQAV